MGGNAIKKVPVSRFTLEKYNIVKDIILKCLTKYFECSVVVEAPEKTSFGDMDILYISKDDLSINKVIETESILQTPEIVSNGNVTSIAFSYESEYYQVDFIKCLSEEHESTKMYFSYGDIGGIIGRMTDAAGIKFGGAGLWINYYPTGNVCEHSFKIMLTNNPKVICDYLNLDYEKYLQGFKSEMEIFEWLCGCKFFYTDIFNIELLNHSHKERAQKRKMYMKFIEYIQSIEPRPLQISFKEHILISQTDAINVFDKQSDLDMEMEKIAKNRKIKEKFNGKHFIKLGVNQKDIGKFIEKFKEFIAETKSINFDDFILQSSEETIFETIKGFLNSN